jgi:DNA repair exonuclease SbcCD ATPase subunit
MRLDFESLRIVNFGSFKGKHEIELAGQHPALNFVRGRNLLDKRLGSNGAGKSTLWNALSWCLTGKTTQGLLGPDVRPWSGDGQTIVEVVIKGDKKRSTIVRKAGPNSVTLDGSPVLQPAIDRLLGMSFEVFRQTILLGQGRPLFHDLPNSEKLTFLSDVLDLERWDKYSKKAQGLAGAMEEERHDFESRYNADTAIVASLKDQIVKQEREYESWEKDRQSSLKTTEKEFDALTKSLAALDTRLGALTAEHDMSGYNLGLQQGDLDKLVKVQRLAERELAEVKAGHTALMRHHDEAKQRLEDLLKARTCPTCGQPIKNQKDFLKNKARVEEQVTNYFDDAADLDIEYHTNTVAKAKKQLEECEALVKSQQKDLDKLGAEKDLIAHNRNEEAVRHSVAKAEVERLSTSANPHRKRLVDLKKSRDAAVSGAKEAKAEIDRLEKLIDRRLFWVKSFKDIRLFVLEDVLHELELVTNSMLDAVGLTDWEVSYAVERETKSGSIRKELLTTVTNPRKEGEGVKWSAWSGGEGQRLRLVGALALSEVLLARAGVECNIEVLDEPTRHLSTEGALDLCEFLSDRAQRLGRTIWLVDHKAMESSYFDKVITVTKGKAGSSLSLRNGGANE